MLCNLLNRVCRNCCVIICHMLCNLLKTNLSCILIILCMLFMILNVKVCGVTAYTVSGHKKERQGQKNGVSLRFSCDDPLDVKYVKRKLRLLMRTTCFPSRGALCLTYTYTYVYIMNTILVLFQIMSLLLSGLLLLILKRRVTRASYPPNQEDTGACTCAYVGMFECDVTMCVGPSTRLSLSSSRLLAVLAGPI